MLRFPRGRVWIASYPKSGNTWMRFLLSGLADGCERPLDINAATRDEGIASSRSMLDDLTMVDSQLLTSTEIERLRPHVHDADAAESGATPWQKVHDAYRCLASGAPLLGRAARIALYLVRDPRDVAVSLAFHSASSFDSTIQALCDPDHQIGGGAFQVRQQVGSWSDHVASWIDQPDVPVQIIRYEDLHAAPLETFCRALDFLGADYDRDAAARVVRRTDFAALQRQEHERGFRERVEGQKLFFRQGEVGNWRRHLDRAQVQVIEASHGTMMARLGYRKMNSEDPK